LISAKFVSYTWRSLTASWDDTEVRISPYNQPYLQMMKRRQFLQLSAGLAVLHPALKHKSMHTDNTQFSIQISLAEWSLHRAIYSGKIHPLDFPKVAKQRYGIDAVEYVNAFFMLSTEFVTELKKRAAGEGVKNLILMIDEAGRLGDSDNGLREDAVERHKPWVETAASLGCHSVRVNARSDGDLGEQMRLMADGLTSLAEFAVPMGVNVLVENHGGPSSQGDWLVGLMETADHPRVGTLPDFGNWYQTPWGQPPADGVEAELYDHYRGVDQMMAYAKGVSAKCYDFDEEGNETTINFERMLDIVRDHDFEGYIGIEYEGTRLSEHDGILAAKKLLERIVGQG
jgi:L-ribulose-5-phosphate 3-epimerase